MSSEEERQEAMAQVGEAGGKLVGLLFDASVQGLPALVAAVRALDERQARAALWMAVVFHHDRHEGAPHRFDPNHPVVVELLEIIDRDEAPAVYRRVVELPEAEVKAAVGNLVWGWREQKAQAAGADFN